MSTQSPLQTIQEIYSAFGTGNVPAILERISEDVDWESYGPPEIPFAGRFDGSEGAARFFATIVREVEHNHFEPLEFVADDENVVVHGILRATVRANGRQFETPWVHKFTVRDGKVVRVRVLNDTARIAEAFRPAGESVPA